MSDARPVGRWIVVALVALALVAAGCGPKAPAGVMYHCPMHPTYVSDKPGDCPICGMRLVPIAAKAASTAAPTAAPAATPPAASEKGERKLLYYRSPMDPRVTSPVPAKDSMGMDFVPVYAGEAGGAAAVPDHATVTTTEEGRRLAGVQTAAATREKLDYSVRTVGTVAADETRVRHVHVKTPGYVEKLYVDFTGQVVTAGRPILSIYSPELLASQEEYLRAKEAAAKLGGSTLPEVRAGGEELVRAARRRLELFDVPRSFLDELDRTGKPQRAVTFAAPVTGIVTAKQVFEGHQIEPGMELFTVTDLSAIWIEAAVYEYEARAVRLGQRATFTLPYGPGKEFSGKIVFIAPVVDPASRTITVRFDFANPDLSLKPGMYVNVDLRIDAPEGVVVPDSAVMDTGTRQLVFVEETPGTFVPREVKVGVRDAGKALILSGVAAGERVAVAGNFLLDSESRLRAAIPAAEPAAGAR